MIERLEPLKAWWAGRSVREQRLLAVMLALLAGVVLWFGIIAPALAWRADAAERRIEASRDLARIEAITGGPGDAAAAVSAATIQETAARLANIGQVAATFNPAEGGVGFSVTGARTNVLFNWLATLQAQGIETRSLSVSENADATLNAQGLLAG